MTSRIRASAATIVAAGSIVAAAAAQAQPLTIVSVEAPAVNCVFNTSCAVTVTDWIGAFTLAGDTGYGRLQSRSYPGLPPAPAAGATAYLYRLDLTDVRRSSAETCVTRLALDFGPVAKQPYSPKGSFDIFVITKGGIGSVAPSSADQAGNAITLTFSPPVCPGATSYFFGLASKTNKPIAGDAQLSFNGGSTWTFARVP